MRGQSAELDAARGFRSGASPLARPDVGGGRRSARAPSSRRLAVALQASLLVEHSPAAVADAFVASRIGGRRGHTFGSLDVDLAASAGALIERAG